MCLSFIDIKDAFLLVPQRERILVEKPSWWWNDDGHSKYQRNAAARFFDFLCDHLQELDFENSLLPSLFRHKTKKVILCSHVDDLVLCGERGELEWLIEELKKRMTLRGGDVLPSADHDEQEPIRFLKGRHFFTMAGIVIRKLYGLEARKPRKTPDINGAVYDAKELDEKGKYKFRSAMRALLYLSQDRVDLQHAVRRLSQFMAEPTVSAGDGVKHLILYLKGTPDLGVLPLFRVPGKSKLDEVRGGSNSVEQEKELVEAFTDADWAGDKSTRARQRHSVSSALIFVDNRLVTSWSRTQKSIALSSCKSEYLSAVGGSAKSFYVARLWSFLTRTEVVARFVSDSSRCRAFAQRARCEKDEAH